MTPRQVYLFGNKIRNSSLLIWINRTRTRNHKNQNQPISRANINAAEQSLTFLPVDPAVWKFKCHAQRKLSFKKSSCLEMSMSVKVVVWRHTVDWNQSDRSARGRGLWSGRNSWALVSCWGLPWRSPPHPLSAMASESNRQFKELQ
jgi:hypothetical protein